MAVEKTRNEIINFALDLLGVKAANEEAADPDVALAAQGLDDLVKSYQADGAHLWSRRSATLFMKPAQIKYTIGPQAQEFSTGSAVPQNNLDHAAEEYTASTVLNAVLKDANIFQLPVNLKITCDVDSDILVGDKIAFIISTGLWWSKVKAIDPPNIMLDDNFTENIAADTIVNWYTTDLPKALRVPDARRQQGFAPTSNEIEMIQMGRIDYLNLPNKHTSGTPVQFYYNPQIDTGEMFLWNAPVVGNNYINMTVYLPLDVFNDAESAADFPNEWVGALKYKLALYLAPAFGGLELPPSLVPVGEELYQRALAWDQGDEPVFFQYGPGIGR